MSRTEFWAITPCELWQEFEAANAMRTDRLEVATFLAWQIKRIDLETQNSKRLPALKTLLDQLRPARRPTSGEMHQQFFAMSQQLRGMTQKKPSKKAHGQ